MSQRFVMLVPLSRFAVGARGRLALPMNQVAADGVVAVAGGRRELPGRLVQRECEQIGGASFGPIDARLPGRDLRVRRQCRTPRGSRAVCSEREPAAARQDASSSVWLNVIDARVEDIEQIHQLRSNLRMRPDRVRTRPPASSPCRARGHAMDATSMRSEPAITRETVTLRHGASHSETNRRYESIRTIVVDVEQPGASPSKGIFVAARGLAPKGPRPREDQTMSSLASVDVVQLESGLVEESAASVTVVVASRDRRSSSTFSGHREGTAARMFSRTSSVATRSSSMWQPAGRNGKPSLDLLLEILAGSAEQRPKSPVESELLAMMPDEVEHRADRLARKSDATLAQVAAGTASGCRSGEAAAACRRPGCRCPH